MTDTSAVRMNAGGTQCDANRRLAMNSLCAGHVRSRIETHSPSDELL